MNSKRLLKLVKKNKFASILVGIFVLGLASKVIFLGSIPGVVSHDEIYYFAQAKTIALSGKDPAGTWHFSDLTSAHSLYAELPGLIMSLGAVLFPNNPLVAGRIVHAVMGSALPVVLALFVYKLFDNKKYAVTVAVVAALNPWLFQMSRMSFDSLLSIFFYFLGGLMLLSEDRRLQQASLLPFFLGFFQYQGHKLVFIPFVWLLLGYLFFKHKNRLSMSRIAVGVLTTTMFIFFVLNLSGQSASTRSGDLIFANSDNYLSVITKKIPQKYLESFDFTTLFLRGETFRNPTAIWKTGIFYTVDVVFLAIGLLAAYQDKKHRWQWLLIVAVTLIGPIPSALNKNETWIFLRSSFLFPGLLMLISYGVFKLWHLPRFRYLTRLALIIVVGLSGAKFSYEYFFKYPYYSAVVPYWGERVASDYVQRVSQKTDKPVLWLADEAWFVFNSYLVYSNSIDRQTLPDINRAFQTNEFALGTVEVNTRCMNPEEFANYSALIYDNSIAPCDSGQIDPEEIQEGQIRALSNGTTIYKVTNDELCKQFFDKGPLPVRRSSLNIERLSDEEFCRTYFHPSL